MLMQTRDHERNTKNTHTKTKKNNKNICSNKIIKCGFLKVRFLFLLRLAIPAHERGAKGKLGTSREAQGGVDKMHA
jgi:hypothetical protein